MQLSNVPLPKMETAATTIHHLRRRLLQVVLSVLALASLAFTFSTLQSGASFTGTNIIAPLATFGSIALLVVVTRGQLIHITGILVISYLTIMSVYLYSVLDDVGAMFLLLCLASITGALLLSRPLFIIVNILTSVMIVLVSVLSASAEVASDSTFVIALITISFGMIPIAIGMITRYSFVQIQRVALRSERSVSLLAANADIARSVSELSDLMQALNRSAEIIRDRFGVYHVSIFLIDNDHRYAHLAASTGDVGEQMLAREHRLPINSQSVVGRTAQAQDVIVSRHAEQDTRQSFNELLPLTRSELGVPIIDSEGIIGVLDVQSQRSDVFTPTETDALRVIASQLATAIRDARLIEDKERSIRENKRLFIEAETNLREIQRLNRQLTRQAWADYLGTDRRIDGVSLSDNSFNNRAEWSEEMIAASLRRRPITEDIDDKRKIAVPIELRGEVVGAIEVETKRTAGEDDMVDMIRSISQRLAVSLDNARLFEESHEATAQEQRVSEIVSQYQTADSVDELLRVTLEGLAETLGAEQASIRLGVVPEISATETVADTLQRPDENGGTSS